MGFRSIDYRINLGWILMLESAKIVPLEEPTQGEREERGEREESEADLIGSFPSSSQ